MKFIILTVLIAVSTPGLCQRIAITFDDAPTQDTPVLSEAERAKKILSTLKQHYIKQAGFFVITGNIHKNNEKILRDYANAGHVLGNHSHTHLSPSAVSIDAYNADVVKADSVMKSLHGSVSFYRYPFLNEGRTKEKRDSIRSQLAALNLANGYVTVDNYDWFLNGELRKAVQAGKKVNYEKLKKIYIDHIFQSILFYDAIAVRYLGRSPNHVLLLHENDLAALFLGDLLTHLRNSGWKFIDLLEAYNDPIAKKIPDVLFNGQGRVAALAVEKGGVPKDLVQESEDEEYLRELLLREKVFE